MTVEEFFARFNGQGIDFDHAFGYQCMDLAEEYNQDVVGAPRLGGNAIDVWTNFPANWYTQIINTPDNFPNEGDLILWTSRSSDMALIYSCSAFSRWLSEAISWSVLSRCSAAFCSLFFCIWLSQNPPMASIIGTMRSCDQSQRVFLCGFSIEISVGFLLITFVVILGYPVMKGY